MGLLDNTFKRLGYEKKSGQPVQVEQKTANMTTGSGAWFDLFGGNLTPSFTSFNTIREQMRAYTDWVYAAAHTVAESCATIDLRLFENNTPVKNAQLQGKLSYHPKTLHKYLSQTTTKLITRDGQIERIHTPMLKELDAHPLLDLLNNPNPFMTKDEFFEMSFLHLELSGDAFWAINRDKKGKPFELWPMMPNYVDIVPDKEKFILGYIYNINGEQVPFAPEDVIHYMYSNPNDFRRGMSTVAAAARAIDTDAHAADYNRKFFYNSAQPDAILFTDSEIDEKVYKRIASEWKDIYGGAANAHRTAILENGLKYQQISLTQKDMDFLAGRNFNRDMILALFGVPKSIIGLDESQSRANAETAEYVFARNKVKAKMFRMTNRITMSLASQFDTNLVCTFTDPVPDDKAFLLEEKQKALGSSQALGWWTINEARALEGKEPIEGGDEIYANNALIGIGKLSQAELDTEKNEIESSEGPSKNGAGKEGDIDGTEGSSTKPTSSGSGTEASSGGSGTSGSGSGAAKSNIYAGQTKRDKQRYDKLQKRLKVLQANKELEDSKKKEADQISQHFLVLRDSLADSFESDFLHAARKRFDDQKKEVLQNLEHNLSGKRWKAAKVPKVLKAQLDNLFNADMSVQAWSDAFNKIYAELNQDVGSAAYHMVKEEGEYSGETPMFTDWLTNRVQRIAGAIDDETVKQLRASLLEGISKGESIPNLVNRVESIYSASAGYRAERIARTESIDASTWSSIEAWKQSGVVEGTQWLTANDPCEYCESMANETQYLNDTYKSLGDVVQGVDGGTYEITYTDVVGPPLHPSCRCTLIPVISMSGEPLE